MMRTFLASEENLPIGVLVVDDDMRDLALISQMLTSSAHNDFEVFHASDLASALEHLWYHNDVLLLDLNLPDSQGLHTLRRVRDFSPNIPIIVMVEEKEREAGVGALADGAQDYLVKERVDSKALARLVRRQVRKD